MICDVNGYYKEGGIPKVASYGKDNPRVKHYDNKGVNDAESANKEENETLFVTNQRTGCDFTVILCPFQTEYSCSYDYC